MEPSPPAKSDHDLLIELRGDVKHLVKLLDGNGREGLVDKVDRLDTSITRHDVYFALVGAGILILAGVLAERILN